MTIKVKILSAYELLGGAARAANRLHRALGAQGIDAILQVGSRQSDNWRVVSPTGKLARMYGKLRTILDGLPTKLEHTNNSILHSPAWISDLKASQINASSENIVNLHWTCGGYLSVEEIGRITKPVVLTLHDMWAFCGMEHYASDDINARWRHGYTTSNRDPAHSGLDIDRWVWQRKQNAWKRYFHVICPSNWLADCARNSALMHNWPITVVPNPLDTETFKPLPKLLARKILCLPLDAKLVLFGAMGGIKSPIKGWDFLQPALAQVATRVPNVHGVIFGQLEPQHPPALGLPLHWMGNLHDDVTLALLYSAADVMVVPSRQENLPQSGTEAQACGCPVVAFNTTGLPDVVVHGETGYLAEAYSSEDLAKGIEWVLADEARYVQLSNQARARAVRLWSPEVVVPQYMNVYQSCISSV